MRRAYLFIPILFSSLVFSQDTQSIIEPSPDPARSNISAAIHPTRIIEPDKEFRFTNRVIFVIDVSGSMRQESKLQKAIRSACFLLDNGSDDFRAAIITFTSEFEWWSGIQDPCQHDRDTPCNHKCDELGWSRVPDFLPYLFSYLKSLSGKGETDPSKALRVAIENDNEDVTVVLISDGLFNIEPVINAINSAQHIRKMRGQVRLPIMVWGVGAGSKNRQSLKSIADVGGGGMWIYSESSPTDNQDGR